MLSLAAFAVRSGFATVRSVRPGSFGVVIHSVPAKSKTENKQRNSAFSRRAGP